MTSINTFTKDFFCNLSNNQLLDPDFLSQVLLKSGLNNEILHEQPKELSEYFGSGYGLKIWQYPNQFVPYLLFLAKYAERIDSYLEIGTRYGGTFIFTNEFLNKFTHQKIISIGCDIISASPNLEQYTTLNPNAQYVSCNSHSIGFKDLIANKHFSVALIDADHSYSSVKKDTELVIDQTEIIVLHDIVSSVCPGVVKYWTELKHEYNNIFNFYEFIDQYESVAGSFLGIGCAVKKTFDTVQ